MMDDIKELQVRMVYNSMFGEYEPCHLHILRSNSGSGWAPDIISAHLMSVTFYAETDEIATRLELDTFIPSYGRFRFYSSPKVFHRNNDLPYAILWPTG